MKTVEFTAMKDGTEDDYLFLKPLEFVIRQLLEPHQRSARARHATDELVEFQMDCFGISVLSVLNQEHHQKGHDGSACVDHELPCVRVAAMIRANLRNPSFMRARRASAWCSSCAATIPQHENEQRQRLLSSNVI